MKDGSHAFPPRSSPILAAITTGLAAVSAVCLGALHVLSPELDPSWHMVSEYAYGAHGQLLRAFFLCWGAAAVALALAVFPWSTRWWQRLGAILLLVSGAGAVGGGLFDIRHELHGLAFGLGVPTLPISALLLTGLLAQHAPERRPVLRISAHATWLSVVAMGVSMGFFIASLKAAGAFHPESGQVLEVLPAGVTSVSGYANRLLVLAYLGWLAIAGAALRHARVSAPTAAAAAAPGSIASNAITSE